MKRAPRSIALNSFLQIHAVLNYSATIEGRMMSYCSYRGYSSGEATALLFSERHQLLISGGEQGAKKEITTL